jgi:hypothetical protein
MRASLRVQVGKHFFSYRYDYREEWLRFTQTLSAQGGFSDMGRHVVRGLADMVESPERCALAEGSLGPLLCPGGVLEHARCRRPPKMPTALVPLFCSRAVG